MEEKSVKKPKHLKAFVIVGFTALALGIIAIIVGVVVGIKISSTAVIAIVASLGAFLCFGVAPITLFIGYSANIANMRVKTAKYVQEKNKDDLKDVMNTGAEIIGGAVKTTAKAVKDGLNDEESKHCIHCGKENKKDAKFCNYCGKSVNE